MTSRLWTIKLPDPDKVMLAPFDYVLAMVGGTRRRVGPERFKRLFPMTVRVHPDVFLAVAAHPLCIDGRVLSDEGVMTIRPDRSLKSLRDVQIDPRRE